MSPGHSNRSPWDAIAEERELLEHIVETDGPFAPDAQKLLDALDERAGEASN